MNNFMLKPFLWLLVALVGVLLIAVIVLLVRHAVVINRLNRGLSNANIRLEHEVVGIGFYVRIIAYILLVACVGVAIHYMAIELPRVLNSQYTNSHIDNLGIDYLGLIVAIFAIIVTLLVGWQIFSTIKAKEELRETQKEIKDNLQTEINELRRMLGNLSTQQAKTEGIVEENKRTRNTIDLSLPSEVTRRVYEDMAKKKTPLYHWLWLVINKDNTADDIVRIYLQTKKTHPDRVAFIEGITVTKLILLELIDEIRPQKIAVLDAMNK